MVRNPSSRDLRGVIVKLALALAVSSAVAGEARRPAASSPPAPPPAPMGVFGADMPAEGKFGVAVTPNFFNLSGIRMGTRTVSNEQIVSTVPFFLNPKQPVRIVPQNIAGRSQTVTLSYGVTPDFAVFVTTGAIERSLDTLVFRGASGILPLTRNTPDAIGFVDSTLSGVYRLYRDDVNRLQMTLGFSFPTGTNHAVFDNFVKPNGSVETIRGFYGMQPGTGTFDILPGVVYAGCLGPWSWGASYRGRFPLGVNPDGYKWGDAHEFSEWGGYSFTPGLTTTLRATTTLQGPIRGFDPAINGPAVPANPAFYGGQRVELFGGGSIGGKFIGYDNVSLAGEVGLPVYQNLNGPQIMKNWQAGLSLRLEL